MSRASRRKRRLQQYSLGEELVNAISHGMGMGLAIAGGVLCIVKAADKGSGWLVGASWVYLLCMMSYFCMSTLYHAFSCELGAKNVFKKIANCFSFVFLAGVYMPYLWGPLMGKVGWIMFGIIIAVVAVGIVFSAVDSGISKIMVYASYIVMALLLFTQSKAITLACGKETLIYFACADVLYVISALIFGVKNRKKYFHSVFHLLCIGAGVLYFLGIYGYMM